MYAEIDADCRRIIEEAEAAVSEPSGKSEIGLLNQAKVLSAFKEASRNPSFYNLHRIWLQRSGQETLEQVFATVFDGESALVRQQIASARTPSTVACQESSVPVMKFYLPPVCPMIPSVPL